MKQTEKTWGVVAYAGPGRSSKVHGGPHRGRQGWPAGDWSPRGTCWRFAYARRTLLYALRLRPRDYWMAARVLERIGGRVRRGTTHGRPWLSRLCDTNAT
jgi:hypothetical protein